MVLGPTREEDPQRDNRSMPRESMFSPNAFETVFRNVILCSLQVRFFQVVFLLRVSP